MDSTTLLGLAGIGGTPLGAAAGAAGVLGAARISSRAQAHTEEQKARRQAYSVCATVLLARRDAIAALHRGSAVGTPDLHVLNGTARQLHGADVVVLVTNGQFSSKCAPLARSQHIYLVDRRVLGEWAAGGRPIWELLRLLPPPRRPSAMS
ncbi:restriction endonuclease [Streptomyces sp. NPDC056670]|uniref:restriction endonuclease n=1 Tax=Streptomyces sp. NPDC056670 TaxID=3345904 RepID=UPI0036ABB01C